MDLVPAASWFPPMVAAGGVAIGRRNAQQLVIIKRVRRRAAGFCTARYERVTWHQRQRMHVSERVLGAVCEREREQMGMCSRRSTWTRCSSRANPRRWRTVRCTATSRPRRARQAATRMTFLRRPAQPQARARQVPRARRPPYQPLSHGARSRPPAPQQRVRRQRRQVGRGAARAADARKLQTFVQEHPRRREHRLTPQ